MNDFQKLKNKGIIFDSAKHFITEKNRAQLAQDAALTTPANSGIPGILQTTLIQRLLIFCLLRAMQDRFSRKPRKVIGLPIMRYSVLLNLSVA